VALPKPKHSSMPVYDKPVYDDGGVVALLSAHRESSARGKVQPTCLKAFLVSDERFLLAS
jgi:hypothetical protein